MVRSRQKFHQASYRCAVLDMTNIDSENITPVQWHKDNLSLVSVSERPNIAEIATLDKDFDIYRRYRKQPFNRIFYL